VADPRVRIPYSPRNLLDQVIDAGDSEAEVPHIVTYSYDARSLRVVRAETPTNGPGTSARRYTTYLPELRLLSVTADDAPNVWESATAYEIVWFGDRPVAQITPGAPVRYTFVDHLGTPTLQTDAAATVIWRVEHEPFGNIYAVREGNRADQPLRFPGQELATTWEGPEESSNVFRWYRSGWGRYTQADPEGRGDVDAYLYVSANPLLGIDLLGLYEVSDTIVKKPHSNPSVICGCQSPAPTSARPSNVFANVKRTRGSSSQRSLC
jgi:RHS repeat-associated protein